jgi:hypothetical protein
MGVEAAARTHIPATQDSSTAVAISHCCNLQSDTKSDFGQVQTHKVMPEALALFPLHQDTITKKRNISAAKSNSCGSAGGPRNFFGSAGYHEGLCWAAPSERTQSRFNPGGYVQLSLNNNSLAQ